MKDLIIHKSSYKNLINFIRLEEENFYFYNNNDDDFYYIKFIDEVENVLLIGVFVGVLDSKEFFECKYDINIIIK